MSKQTIHAKRLSLTESQELFLSLNSSFDPNSTARAGVLRLPEINYCLSHDQKVQNFGSLELVIHPDDVSLWLKRFLEEMIEQDSHPSVER